MSDIVTSHEKIDVIPTNEIFEYIRRRKEGRVQKIGVILGTQVGSSIIVGWSKCNVKAGDKFDAKYGIDAARARTAFIDKPCPLCINSQVHRFGARCVRYFKDATKLILPKTYQRC